MGNISALFDDHDALGLGTLVREGQVTALELVEVSIDRIEAINDHLGAVSIKTYDLARHMASDPALPDGPFKGVPFLLKDLGTFWDGVPTTNSCTYFKNVVGKADMEVVRRI